MASVVGTFLGPALQVGQWVAKPIIRQLNYLCCFTTNINGLEAEAKTLDDETEELHGKVDRERDNLQTIATDVKTWLENSKNTKEETTKILDKVPDVKSGCSKLGARFSISRRAKKTTDRIKKLRDDRKSFVDISYKGASTATQEIPLGKAYGFESRKQIEENIIATLMGEDVHMVGICGIGGLGKTTMAERIINRVLKDDNKVFQEAVKVVVSQQVDNSKIQLDISRSLGLDLTDETPEDVRRKNLYARLSDAKRTLLVLDDVWKRLKLEDLGIPLNSKGCTILITSRNEDALIEMRCGEGEIFGMEVLSDKDAWFLFREIVGTCVDDPKVKPIAEEVVKKCKGIPLSLDIVGALMIDEMDDSIWTDKLRELSQSHENIPGFIAEIYNPVKVSYDYLSPMEKSLFLLCCLYPEDSNIHVEKLTWFCKGLGIFPKNEIKTIKQARGKMRVLIKLLKRRSFLLDSEEGDDYVRMHDGVRDVCIFIAKEEGRIGSNNCTWISSSQRAGEGTELPTGLANLRLLFMSRYHSNDEEFKFDSAFDHEATRDLSVLCIQNYHSLTSLPRSLTSLNSLVLDSCQRLETISAVGELVNLEILICRDCDLIVELPQEIKRLHQLKLLELTLCWKLQRIGRGIIASLVELEELKIKRSFNKWEAEDREERENAGLRELEALTKLRCLEIEIEDPALATEKMHLSSEIDRFYIMITTTFTYFESDIYNKRLLELHGETCFDKTLILEMNGETCLGDWIEKPLLRDVESLSLRGNGANNVDLSKCRNINWLKLNDIAALEEICDATFLQNLEGLDLGNLAATEQLWKSNRAPLFTKLSSIYIHNCPRLRNLGKLSMAGNNCLSHLKYIYIEKCEMMEQVFLWNEGEESEIMSNSFLNLQNFHLEDLPALEQLWKSSSGSNHAQPLFTKLSSIYIHNCPRLRNLGQLSAAGKDCLPQLEKLHVEECEMMEQVLLWNANATESANHPSITKIFPKLTEVALYRLPNLVTFYQGIEHIQFPLLSEMNIRKCPKMISMGSTEFPRLTVLVIKKCPKMMWGGNSRSADIDDDCSHLFCQVSFGNLNYLQVGRNPFCRHEIPSSLFNGLEELEITEYHGNMSLFTSSMAGNLVNLKTLYIANCGEMLKVIEDEEEQVVSGGERTTALIFPKLEDLYLWNLPKLVSFCEWKCDIELLSLTYVNIDNCCAMRNFTLGSLSTPNLGIFDIDDKAIAATEDLNIALQQHLARAKVEEEENDEEEDDDEEDEEEGGEENQEAMGEIDSSSKI